MEKNSNNNTSISFGFKFNLLIIFRLNNIFYCGRKITFFIRKRIREGENFSRKNINYQKAASSL